jgi:uncharacterized protein (TIGR03437 family)
VGASQISVISGLSVVPQAGSFQTQPARAGLPFLELPVVNADTGQPAIYAGSTALLNGQNLGISPSGLQLTLNDIPLQVTASNPTQLSFVVPNGFPTGPATLRLNNGTANSFPVIVQIDNPPPVVAAVNNASGSPLPGTSVNLGELLNVLVTGLNPSASTPTRVRMLVSGVEMPVQQINALPNGVYQIQFVLTQSFGGAQVPLAVSVDGSASAPFLITVR